AIKENKNVFVKGEEDLLAIPAVLLAGKNTAVVYGLPNKGICLVKISPKTKKNFKELLKKFIVRS
ncbi:GTP-dependent dephospho-CoA kinase family protein, partial [Patescibacteria group bacterium]|nr:GTP-dependent dephospho-CoA kinase family protein [Patescibacteria group bacterium]